MIRFNVHIFREMRLYYPGIEANSPLEAAQAASKLETGKADKIEDCQGEDLGALVDVEGDESYAKSELIDFEPNRFSKHGAELIEALSYLLEQTVDQDLKYGISLTEGEEEARAKALAVIAKVHGEKEAA